MTDRTPSIVIGQCAQALVLIRQHRPILSFLLTADHAISEAAARIHELRGMGFNILTAIHSMVAFRGVERRKVASYSLGTTEWACSDFFDEVE